MGSNSTNKQHFDESNRCIGCLKPSCKQACPIGNDIPNFLQLVKSGEYDKAVELIGHPFGEICGYVCPHEQQCQGGCVLGKKGQAVQMGAVEREVFAHHPYRVQRKVRVGSKTSGLKVAVVGGGVSGLTLAVKLYEQGADITIFERDELLSTLKLIPDFRLPREAIGRVLASIEGKFTVVKRNVNFADIFDHTVYPWQSKQYREAHKDNLQLMADYDAVYLSTGASVLYKLGVEGEELATPYDEFLKNGCENCGKVVVIGGGNTAMDCARVAKRNGWDVTVAYRRARQDMPAFAKEIDEAYAENVEFVYNVAPIKLERVDGKLLLTLAKTVGEGRGKLTVTDETSTIECDTVVAALGSKFDKDNLYGAFYASLIDSKPHNPTNPRFNFYLGGDALGASTVANAVADGIQVAHDILKNYTKSK